MLRHPEQDVLSDGVAEIGESAIRAGGQMPQHSGTPQAHSGGDSVRMTSALESSTPLSPFKTPATLSNPAPTSAPQTKPPTPAPPTKQTTPTLQPVFKSSNAEPRSTTPAPVLPSKAPTPVPLSRTPTPIPPSKTPTPRPKSRCTSPGLTSTSVRNTDYDPANPIRPMPGLKSPSTEPDSIFPGVGARDESATGVFNPLETGDNYDDPPPPFKEFESPVHPHGANFGAGADNRKGPGEQVAEGSRDEGATAEGDAKREGQGEVAKGEGEEAITNTNIGDVDDVGGQDSGGGTKKTIETSQDVGDHTRGADSLDREDGAPKKWKDSQEQEKSEQDGEGNKGAVDDSQAACEDANPASGDTQIAGGETQNIEAETHRNAFLLQEMARLEKLCAQEKLDSSDEQYSSEIQGRLNAVKARISRIIFAGAFMFHRSYTVLLALFTMNKDPPRRPPPVSEVSTAGKSAQELTSALTNTIVDLLLERQDAEPIKVIVSSATKVKQKNTEKLLKEFNANNNFSIRSETGQLSTLIIV
ncbi:hypothetical protein BD769DRAFT_1490595 [Suillus cothurnatus]|nr:hypothetical protein BD769DRAFT_1490595 [Suillus cothurnatus]